MLGVQVESWEGVPIAWFVRSSRECDDEDEDDLPDEEYEYDCEGFVGSSSAGFLG